MTSRSDMAGSFLVNAGWGDATQTFLAGDASNRKYFRVFLSETNKTAVLMDAPPQKGENTTAFIKISNYLRISGLSAPEIIYQDLDNGFLLIEDLGDQVFAKEILQNPKLEQPFYSAAVDVLIKISTLTPPAGLLDYNAKIMAEYINPVFDWYQAEAIDQPIHGQKKILGILQTALQKHCSGPRVIALRDYHAENLLWLPERSAENRVGLLDFQDAVITHPAYDLVSLLEDARRDVAPEIQQQMIAQYVAKTNANPDNFLAAYHTCGAQRNLRILGIFTRLCIQAGKPGYIDLIPRVWGYLQNDLSHPELSLLNAQVFSTIPEPTPEVLQRLKDKCATIPML